MNLFAARLTGKMLSTETFEKTVYDMQERVKRYRQIEKSPELAEYNDLKKRVESSDFKERKHELVSRKYKDTDEGRKTANYKRLIANRDIRRYKEALNDPVFQDFGMIHEFSTVDVNGAAGNRK